MYNHVINEPTLDTSTTLVSWNYFENPIKTPNFHTDVIRHGTNKKYRTEFEFEPPELGLVSTF